MRAASRYTFISEGADAVTVEVRPSHWLQLERTVDDPGGRLEQVLRVIHIASGDAGAFDAWADSLTWWGSADEDEADDDAARPTETQPKPSPA